MEIKDTEWLSEPKNEGEGVTRRAVLTTAMTAGFALAVQPVSAETVITDTKGLTAGMTKFKGADGVEVPAYYAVPAKLAAGKKPPIVLVVQEIFGVHEHIKDVCRRFAKQGYFAIAPELYVRQGSVTDKPMNEIFPVVAKVPDAQVMTDLDAAVAYAASTGKADASRVAITGFCWGGRVVWLYAAHNPKLKAGAAWYGRLVGQSNPLQPKSPTELAASVKAPVLGLYGAKDKGIPLESIDGMRAALNAAGNTKCEIIVYPDSEHGFHADYRPSYNEKDAKDGFTKLLAWFKKNGA
jgi:carboxymethylenebutenolidase